jgi:hypothetical protein
VKHGREFNGVSVAAEVDVHHMRRFADEVVVQRALIDASGLQDIDHGIDLGLEQYQIAHGHRMTVRLPEGDPRPEGQRGFDGDPFRDDGEVAAREANLVDVTRECRAGTPQRLLDVFPVASVRDGIGGDKKNEDECG